MTQGWQLVPLGLIGLLLLVTYTNWCLGEPNDVEPGEDVAQFRGGEDQACWNDVPNQPSWPGIAEVETGRREEIETRIAGLERALQLIDTGENFSFQTADGKRVYQEVNLTGIDAIDRGVVKKWRANPGLMLYKMQANFYKFSWLLIPLSIPFVWLLFAWKRRFRAYDHAIFVTYSLSFMTLLFVVLSLFTLVPSLGWLAMTAMVFIPPFHLYKQLRYGYDLSRFSAFWRLMVLSLFIWVILLLFLQVLLLLGAY